MSQDPAVVDLASPLDAKYDLWAKLMKLFQKVYTLFRFHFPMHLPKKFEHCYYLATDFSLCINLDDWFMSWTYPFQTHCGSENHFQLGVYQS